MAPVLVPPEMPNATVSPPLPSKFPAASRVVSVRVSMPPAATTLSETVTVDVTAEAGPGNTSIVGLAVVSGLPLIVALTESRVPARTPLNRAVSVPEPAYAAGEGTNVPVDVPATVENTTVAPPGVVSAFPDASLSWMVKRTLAPEAMLSTGAVATDVTGEAAPAVTVTVGSVELTVTPLMVA